MGRLKSNSQRLISKDNLQHFMKTLFNNFSLTFFRITTTSMLCVQLALSADETSVSEEPVHETAPITVENYVDANEIQEGLYRLNHLFSTHYALKNWKKKILGWEPQKQLAIQLDLLEQSDIPLTYDRVKGFYLDYILPLKDEHLSISFSDQRLYRLPVSVITVEGKFLVESSTIEEVHIGDELTHLNGDTPREFAIKHRIISDTPYRIGLSQNPRYQRWQKLAETRELQSINQRLLALPGCVSFIPDSKELQLTFKSNQNVDTEQSYQVNTSWINSSIRDFELFSEPNEDTPAPITVEYRTERNITIAIVKIRSFAFAAGKNYEHLKNVYDQIIHARKNSQCIVVDVRNNGGGMLDNLLFLLSSLSDFEGTTHHMLELPSKESYATMMRRLNYYQFEKAQLLNLLQASIAKNAEETEITFWQGLIQRNNNNIAYSEQYRDAYKNSSSNRMIRAKQTITPMIKDAPILPLYVIQNGFSASASEIFAGCIQSCCNATVAGSLSAGATSRVQEYELYPHKGIKKCAITSGFTLIEDNGKERIIEDIGVIPDITLQLQESDLATADEMEKDQVLFKSKDPNLDKLIQHIASEAQSIHLFGPGQ